MGLTNKEWTMTKEVRGTRCCCFKSNYKIYVKAMLNKQMFFPDETVSVKVVVDNTNSTRNIKRIICSFN
jgi:hypothetical protein